jgi:hypothetical protein
MALLLIAAGIVLRLVGTGAPAWNLIAMGAVLGLALVFERWRYRGSDVLGASGWHRTEERFEDPESGQIMEVLYDPATGQRRYVKASDAPSGPESGVGGPR